MTDRAKLVVVVDDDAVTRRYYKAVLDQGGYTSRLLNSASAFFDIYDPLQVGCVLLDVMMPGMNGPEMQQRLNVLGAVVPVIFISGQSDLPLAVEAMRNGAFNFLQKPISSADLLTEVGRALDYDRENRQALEQREQIARAFAALTERELDVLRLLITGQSNKVMATTLRLSPRTVELHRARVMEKTGSRSLAHLIRMAIDLKIAPTSYNALPA